MGTLVMGMDHTSTPSRLVWRDSETGDMVTMLEGKVLRIDGLEMDVPDTDPDNAVLAEVPRDMDLNITWRLSDEVMANLKQAIMTIPPLTEVFQRMADAITDVAFRLFGPPKPPERPVRAFAGGKVSGWFAWDGTRWRACKRVAGHGWVYADQWKKYQERGFN